MTNPIPAWSANVSFNVPKDERALLGRLAYKAGAKSVGAFIKQLVALGLELSDRKAAAQLRQIRARYYRPAQAAALLVLFAGITVHAMLEQKGGDLRRSANRVRTVRTVRVRTEQEVAA